MQVAVEPPAVVAPAPPSAPLVLSRRDGTVIVASLDTPLVLSKAGKLESAVLRQAIFLTTSVTTTRAAERTEGPADSYGWTYRSYLQRQMCFTSITGLFSCTTAEIEPLTEIEEGRTPLDAQAAESYPLAEAAGERISARLRLGVEARFATDRRARLDPLLKSSGVMIVPPTPKAPPAPRGPPARRR